MLEQIRQIDPDAIVLCTPDEWCVTTANLGTAASILNLVWDDAPNVTIKYRDSVGEITILLAKT